jgi:dephospho-CoA kinase
VSTTQSRPEGSLPYVIGLTGNIATGKSTVAAVLGSLGADVLDADKLGHWVMRAGTEVYQHIVARFGCQILAPNGEIDRSRLGPVVFADPQALADLESFVHPAVVQETLRWIAASQSSVRVVEAVKLLEAEMDRFCQAVWVVTALRVQQVERLMTTRHLDREAAELRLAAQPASEERARRADVLIDNSGTLAETWRQVLAAWNEIPGVAPVSHDAPWVVARPKD